MSLKLYFRHRVRLSILLISCAVCLLSMSSFAAVDDFVVRIVGISSSGNSVFVDRGLDSQIKNNDYGILLAKQYIEASKKFVYKPVARLRVVKLYNNKSVWLKLKTYERGLIEKDKKFILYSESALLEGRAALSYKRSKIIINKNVKSEIKDSLQEGSETLAKKQSAYQSLAQTHDKEKHLDADVDLVDIAQWEDVLAEKKLYAKSIYKSAYAEDFAQTRRVQTFEKMVSALLNKYNDPAFDKEEFRKLQEGDNGAGTYGSLSTRENRRVGNQSEKREKFYKDLIQKGDSWSDEYSDEELSNLLTDIGDIRERERRKTLLAHKFNYQVYGSFGVNLISNDNLNDTENIANTKYDFELAAEGFFFKRTRALNKFALEASFRRSIDSFYGGSLNAKSVEYSMAAHINWYPGNGPNTMDANIFYIGTHLRFGLSRLSVATTNEEGNYQIFSLPGIRAGLKHNYFNGYGFRIAMGLENITVDRIAKSDSEGTLPDTANYLEGKVSFGISKLF